jgi:hypothetical protein
MASAARAQPCPLRYLPGRAHDDGGTRAALRPDLASAQNNQSDATMELEDKPLMPTISAVLRACHPGGPATLGGHVAISGRTVQQGRPGLTPRPAQWLPDEYATMQRAQIWMVRATSTSRR